MQPRKLILSSRLSPGDIVTMTAAVRDLHATYPGEYLTDVRTPCGALWENNPFITPISDDEGERIDLEYPSIHQSNQRPRHFLEAYTAFLAEKLGRQIPTTAFKGDIHLSKDERSWMSQVEEMEGVGARFWIVVSGGKSDFTAKHWSPERMQEVVDHFAGRIRFVQVGEAHHMHPALRNVIDLRGKTDLRQLVRLVHHADGVICPVTSLMHLAAAVPVRDGRPPLRPCVVIAGGREPAHWERYPGHRYLDTIGALPCCAKGGCWKSRTVALGDGDKKDESLCDRPIRQESGQYLPRCLDMITAADVIRAVESYAAYSEPKPEPAPKPEKRPLGPPFQAVRKLYFGPGSTGKTKLVSAEKHGPALWKELHGRAATITTDDSAWLDAFRKRIPCGDCRSHFKQWLVENPISWDRYFEWTVALHNSVNRKLGKVEVSIEDAWASFPPLVTVKAAVCITIHGGHRKSGGTITESDHLDMLEGAVDVFARSGATVIISAVHPWVSADDALIDRLSILKSRVRWVETSDLPHQLGALTSIYNGLCAAAHIGVEWLLVCAEDVVFLSDDPLKDAVQKAENNNVDYVGGIFLDDVGIRAVSTQCFIVRVSALHDPRRSRIPFHAKYFSPLYHGLEHYMVQTLINHEIPYLRELPTQYGHTHDPQEWRRWKRDGVDTAGDLLLIFRHGLGDAVQFTSVLRHIASQRPDWVVDVASKTGKHTAFGGLCRTVYDMDRDYWQSNRYKQVVDIEWHENGGAEAAIPTTKTTKCLRERLELAVQPELLTYQINITPESRSAAEAYLESIGAQNRGDGRRNVVVIHYQGNTATERKNLDHSVARSLCVKLIGAGVIPVILDWDHRSPLPDNHRIFCPDSRNPIWGNTGTGDANILAALIEKCAAMVGIDSGPLHVAAATTTPSIGVWTKHAPARYFDFSNVLHLVPRNWRTMERPEVVAFQEQNYRWKEYGDPMSEVVVAETLKAALQW